MSYSGEIAFNARKELGFLEDDFDEEPENTTNFSYGKMQLVGHGERTNLKCGRFSTYAGCKEMELHNKTGLDGTNYKGKVYKTMVFHSCDKPSCPICYKKGWAVRQAQKIEYRLAEASKRFGQVEHIIINVPPKYWALEYLAIRKRCFDALKVRGVIGGAFIFHGFRYNKRKGWYWSPHGHVLGYILGGYAECRHCPYPKCKYGCGGFVDKNYRLREKDGIYLKVKGKRKTVGGTAWYQLHHSSIDMTKKRYHVVIWFGVCSYRKLKLTKEKRKKLCPICGSALKKLRYIGDKLRLWKAYGLNREECKERESFEDFIEDGREVWMEKEDDVYRKKWGDEEDY